MWMHPHTNKLMETNSNDTEAKQPASAGCHPTTCSLYIEAAMTCDDVAKVHSFGECWIGDYDRNLRQYWMKALWLYAWEKNVVFDPTLTAPPKGFSPENAER